MERGEITAVFTGQVTRLNLFSVLKLGLRCSGRKSILNQFRKAVGSNPETSSLDSSSSSSSSSL